MKNSTKILVSVAMLFLITLSASCASSLRRSLPALELRTLELAPDFPGFFYQYEVCAKKVVFCLKYEMRKELYDLRDEAVRKKLGAMGFVAKVREKP